MLISVPYKYQNTFNNVTFKWFWSIFSLGAPLKGKTNEISVLRKNLYRSNEIVIYAL